MTSFWWSCRRYTGAITAFSKRAGRAGRRAVRGRRNRSGRLDDGRCTLATRPGRRVRCSMSFRIFRTRRGLLLGRDKRRALLAGAERHDVLIVEDDPVRRAVFQDVAGPADTRPHQGRRRARDASSTEQRSRRRSPRDSAWRWVVAPAALDREARDREAGRGICTGVLDQRIVMKRSGGGVLDAQARVCAHCYRQKRRSWSKGSAGRLATVSRGRAARRFLPLATLPEGCIDAEACSHARSRESVVFVVGSAFYVDRSGTRRMRLSFSQPERLRASRKACERLATAVRDGLALSNVRAA